MGTRLEYKANSIIVTINHYDKAGGIKEYALFKEKKKGRNRKEKKNIVITTEERD